MIRDLLSPKARQLAYSLLGAANVVLVALVARGSLDGSWLAMFTGVASALGFTLAAGNVNK